MALVTILGVASILGVLAVAALLVCRNLEKYADEFVDHVVQKALEHIGPSVVGCDITHHGELTTRLLRREARLTDLKVSNPKTSSFATPHLLKIGEIQIVINWWLAIRSKGKIIEVEQFVMSGLDVHLEMKGTGSNVHEILDFMKGKSKRSVSFTEQLAEAEELMKERCHRIQDNILSPKAAAKKEEDQRVKKKKKDGDSHVSIKRLLVQNIQVEVRLVGGLHKSMTVTDIDVEDFSAGHSVVTLVELVFELLLRSILKNLVKDVKQGAIMVRAKTREAIEAAEEEVEQVKAKATKALKSRCCSCSG